jgi:hypothetical protein
VERAACENINSAYQKKRRKKRAEERPSEVKDLCRHFHVNSLSKFVSQLSTESLKNVKCCNNNVLDKEMFEIVEF